MKKRTRSVERFKEEIILQKVGGTPKPGKSISALKRKESKDDAFIPLKSKKQENQEKYLKFELRIKDSGVGISPENLSKLFMNFGKLDEHAESNKRGTGLGLSICKSLIELMGGTVTVESEVGVGTTFIMSLQTKCKMPSINNA